MCGVGRDGEGWGDTHLHIESATCRRPICASLAGRHRKPSTAPLMPVAGLSTQSEFANGRTAVVKDTEKHRIAAKAASMTAKAGETTTTQLVLINHA